MRTIVFQVTDEVAERMKRHSVYLDVFGGVRWTDKPFELAVGATRWIVEPEMIGGSK